MSIERRDPKTNTVDIWVMELDTQVPLRFSTSTDWTGASIWSPDNSRLLFTDFSGAYEVRALGGQSVEQLEHGLVAAGGWPLAWSPDGRRIVAALSVPETGFDLWVVSADGTAKASPYLRTPFDEMNGTISADGQWLAYMSNESGSWQVYLDSFPSVRRKIPISLSGGSMPVWRKDGRELYFIAPDSQLMAVTVNHNGSTITVSPPRALFVAPPLGLLTSQRAQYAALENGQRFIFNAVVEGAIPKGITVVTNWSPRNRP